MKKIISILLTAALCLSLAACGDQPEQQTSNVSSEVAEAAKLFSPQFDQTTYDLMAAFLADDSNVGTKIKLRGEVDVKEDEAGNKLYTANIEGSNQTWVGPVFVVEGLAEDQYPSYEDLVEIEGVYQSLEDYGYPGVLGVVVPAEKYCNLSVQEQELSVTAESPVTEVHTVVFCGLGISVTYMGVIDHCARFLIQNYSDVDGSVRSQNNTFDNKETQNGFWCSAAAQSVSEGSIELPERTPSVIGFELEIANDNDLEVVSRRIEIQL